MWSQRYYGVVFDSATHNDSSSSSFLPCWVNCSTIRNSLPRVNPLTPNDLNLIIRVNKYMMSAILLDIGHHESRLHQSVQCPGDGLRQCRKVHFSQSISQLDGMKIYGGCRRELQEISL